jgi:hypothetical protein
LRPRGGDPHYIYIKEDGSSAHQTTTPQPTQTQAVASPLAPVLSAAFDPYEMSASGLVLSEDGAHVRCHTASHSHAYLNVGFKEGRCVLLFCVLFVIA